ncbi:hypothetical protein CASFOL_012774 [Castilleja foliolosa]|uniref:J domain-containing protein n=1 Tax=Castilleja foliolosa TaxID=1961234 RepID=A0ABD3DLJ2_9LAMI
MAKKDFPGAKKLAMIAHKLNPDLQCIVQIFLVCQVHCCCSDQESDEGDRDWYKILCLDPTADEARVRRNYKKMALNLHPNKNRFPGSVKAFQLVRRAKAVLIDNEKRRSYDSRCRRAMDSEKTMNCFRGFSGFNNYDKLGFTKFQGSGFSRFRDGPGPDEQRIFRPVKISEYVNSSSHNNKRAEKK